MTRFPPIATRGCWTRSRKGAPMVVALVIAAACIAWLGDGAASTDSDDGLAFAGELVRAVARDYRSPGAPQLEAGD